ncbi:MAG: alanine--glyoxylate aminotransferase family protein [Mesorhizobium sp.]|uniref:pyridoxamine--pyruvate transaminase n=1 Tax=unclassified Mesorhizobium TaxID=325217 RepID=UPI000FCB0C1D|nr:MULTISPECIES: alanine--glyoxylate aminotransferase family protein [unclassified Mesorhizobium]RUV69186.1 alanine--glyoxylate aminotransferase family protein [Mesorhizobium sp. M5C.F.Cr.IN.023.01.1.1]RWF86180.1 MAG: alanine--glyoxylate aminotransferase family protein [Mesorhizobium sp.]RWF91947.1 MAG: alanine--glyoxylate aminotransferase family protein [Mesorhizobium sp.]RWI43634.1 MAG: alanine--glyoxylate aminotransferase family protein [Mesorhizobium sp.]RWI44459.1 MAG: alanine--glyoxylate
MRYLEHAEPVITLTAGPVNAYPDVLRGLGRIVLYDYDPAFQLFYEGVVDKAQKAMRLSNRPVILHGEPVLGLEAAAASLITPDDVVLNLASGVYGKGFGYWAKRYSPQLLEIEVPYNEAIDPQAVAAMLEAHPEITIVSVCHHDTPSGTINPIDAIGAVVSAHGAHLIVDAVSSFGGMKTHPEDCKADIYVTGPNKCLGAPPGLTMMGVSERAWAKMKANPLAPRASMLSIVDWEHAWSKDKPFPFTPSVAEMNGLNVALDLYLNEGPAAVWARHALTAKAMRAGVAAMGLSIWAASDNIASPTTTAVRTPEDIDEKALRQAARARYGVVFSSGRGETLGKLTRIGHMGPTAQPIYAIAALTALGGAMNALGQELAVGKGIDAALAIIDADA